ncbi:MAG: ABC transporter ATP-binding protein [Candidatus Caldarchaeales archaeon]
MDEQEVLKALHLDKRYDKVVALEDVSFSMKKGELVVVLGPSGSGKSTLLLTIAGFVKPDRGDIFLNGERINDVPPYKRNVGVVFQSLALFPHMNVFENIAFPLRIRKLPKEEIRKKVEWMLDVVKLSGLEKRRIDQLSGGQRQRVAIARTLIFEPSILLLDEPLGALDRKLREEMQIEIRRIHEKVEATTLLVTHDQQEAMTMADRIIVMRDGRIEQIGTPMEIYRNPKTLFVAEFVGTSTIFKGRAKSRGDHAIFQSEDGFILKLAENVDGEGYVSIKSEDFKIYESPDEAGGAPVNPVKIVKKFFEGDHILYELCFKKMNIKVKDMEAKKVFKVGQEVYLGCDPEDVKWIP